VEELARKFRGRIIATCTGCGNIGHINPSELARWLKHKRWPDAWPEFARHLRCHKCNERNPRVIFEEAQMQKALAPPKPNASLDASKIDMRFIPQGVDPVAFTNADDRERKRMIRNARG
jgi:hypothetical protein